MTSASLDGVFCGHCGERLPPFGAALGVCAPCARSFPAFAREARRAAGPPVRAADPKDPALATILSIVLPGGGQAYNGQFLKAFLVFVTSPLVVPWVIGVADAFLSARKINRRLEDQRSFAA